MFRSQSTSRLVPVSSLKPATQQSTLAEIVDMTCPVKEVRTSKREKVLLEAQQTVASFREPTRRKLKKEKKAKERDNIAKRAKAKLVQQCLGQDPVQPAPGPVSASSASGNKVCILHYVCPILS
jgi:hypothetical protein